MLHALGCTYHVSNPSRDYSAFLQYLKSTIAFFQKVSNPSRDYSAFLPFLKECFSHQGGWFQTLPGIIPRFYFTITSWLMKPKGCFKPFQGLFRVSTSGKSRHHLHGDRVSNPSRDYSAFLHRLERRCQKIPAMFQTLPGIIPRFYKPLWELNYPASQLFQTLPGIIPRFYKGFSYSSIIKEGLFQTLPGIIPRFYSSPSTINCRVWFQVSNPSRDYSAFLPKDSTPRYSPFGGFKPFQGLFRVSTQLTTLGAKSPQQCFKPFQGLFRVSTINSLQLQEDQLCKFQTLPGIIPRFYEVSC
ncbi:hypothetical protein U27_01538 [Candidatus Vecturithrix granuli]|uniref:Uncharacterized protein n=1 Tax=Vecturithrix granuli TaxID=1499967 RepID=A0A081CAN2_VECG1|nr:hypothetical protein U27_01538 [Candidatus Vecturithrix granuli]